MVPLVPQRVKVTVLRGHEVLWSPACGERLPHVGAPVSRPALDRGSRYPGKHAFPDSQSMLKSASRKCGGDGGGGDRPSTELISSVSVETVPTLNPAKTRHRVIRRKHRLEADFSAGSWLSPSIALFDL
jgi:hypothetical protein